MRDILRNLYGFQAVTAIAETVGNAGPAARDIDVTQIPAMVKNVPIDARQTLWQIDFLDSIAVLKDTILQPFQTFRQMNLPQRIIHTERIAADGFQRAWEMDIIDGIAPMKGIWLDLCHAIWDRYAIEHMAVVADIFRNDGDRIRKDNP